MRRGQISIYLVMTIIGIGIVIAAATLLPLVINLTSEAYVIGEDIMLDSNDTISNIQDSTVRTSLQSGIDTALEATADNIENTTTMWQYSWIIIIGLTFLIIFINYRRIVEIGGGFV